MASLASLTLTFSSCKARARALLLAWMLFSSTALLPAREPPVVRRGTLTPPSTGPAAAEASAAAYVCPCLWQRGAPGLSPAVSMPCCSFLCAFSRRPASSWAALSSTRPSPSFPNNGNLRRRQESQGGGAGPAAPLRSHRRLQPPATAAAPAAPRGSRGARTAGSTVGAAAAAQPERPHLRSSYGGANAEPAVHAELVFSGKQLPAQEARLWPCLDLVELGVKSRGCIRLLLAGDVPPQTDQENLVSLHLRGPGACPLTNTQQTFSPGPTNPLELNKTPTSLREERPTQVQYKHWYSALRQLLSTNFAPFREQDLGATLHA